jgi:hypothetical protein
MAESLHRTGGMMGGMRWFGGRIWRCEDAHHPLRVVDGGGNEMEELWFVTLRRPLLPPQNKGTARSSSEPHGGQYGSWVKDCARRRLGRFGGARQTRVLKVEVS